MPICAFLGAYKIQKFWLFRRRSVSQCVLLVFASGRHYGAERARLYARLCCAFLAAKTCFFTLNVVMTPIRDVQSWMWTNYKLIPIQWYQNRFLIVAFCFCIFENSVKNKCLKCLMMFNFEIFRPFHFISFIYWQNIHSTITVFTARQLC